MAERLAHCRLYHAQTSHWSPQSFRTCSRTQRTPLSKAMHLGWPIAEKIKTGEGSPDVRTRYRSERKGSFRWHHLVVENDASVDMWDPVILHKCLTRKDCVNFKKPRNPCKTYRARYLATPALTPRLSLGPQQKSLGQSSNSRFLFFSWIRRS